MRISVLGIGRMGAPMARNLVEIGHEVTLYNRTLKRAKEAAVKGARVVATVAEAARDAQVALTMVADDEAERFLTFGPEGLLAHLPAGAIHLCMSTIGVETSRNLVLAHAEAGQGYVAAPVFGRPGVVASRHLWIVVGGPDAQVMRCLTIFDALGRGITRVGPRAELAHALKLGGNLLSAVMVEGLSEVLAYGENAGMAPGEYLRLLNTAIFKSPMLDACGGLMIRRAHEPADLTLGSALKETQLVIEASEDLNAVMPLAELLHHRLEAAAVQGWGGQDLTVLSRSCRLAAGLEDLESREASENPLAEGPPTKFTAQSREGRVELDLKKITHFEIIKDAVWAWTQGKRYCTSWKHLTEVERAFGHIAFLRIHRHILLQPEAAMARKASSGAALTALGGGKPEPFPGLEEHLLTHSIEIDENLESPELKVFSQADLEKLDARPPFPDKRSPTGWGNLIERSFGHIPFLRLQRPVPEKPMVVQIQNNLTGETLKTFGEEKNTAALPRLGDSQTALSTKVGEKQELFALEQTTHFEMENDVVWAWVQGKRVRTGWRSLAEVEAAFSQVILLKIQRHILLHPETVLSIHPAFGGRAKVKVAGDVELSISRAAVPRLRELLGM